MKEILPFKSLFLLYLIISANFIAPLLGCKIQQLFNHNMFVKHLLGFITLLFFVVLVDDEYNTKDPNKQVMFTLGIYLLFVITTKIHYNAWVIFILISSTLYILDIYRKNDTVENSTKDTINKIQKILIILNSIVITLGFIVYLGDKKIEYNNKNFDYLNFIFGKPGCKNDQTTYS